MTLNLKLIVAAEGPNHERDTVIEQCLAKMKLGDQILHTSSVEDMIKKLIARAGDQQISELEVIGHGSAGVLLLGSQLGTYSHPLDHRAPRSAPEHNSGDLDDISCIALRRLRELSICHDHTIVRLLGCDTGIRPDLVAVTSKVLRAVVAAPRRAIGPKDFGPNGFMVPDEDPWMSVFIDGAEQRYRRSGPAPHAA